MLLAVAVENTRTLVGLVSEGTVKRHWWVGTDSGRTADEWAVLLDGLLAGESPVSGVAVCSAYLTTPSLPMTNAARAEVSPTPASIGNRTS